MSYSLLIDGELVAGMAFAEIINPAFGRPFAVAPLADVTQAERAIAAGGKAFRDWARRPVEERGDYLRALAFALEERAEDFARLLTLEQGKVLADARGEVAGAVAALRYHADIRLVPRILKDSPSERIVEQRYPLGVVAAVVPWNYPLLLLALKLAPALIAGNVVIAKPAPTTPLATLLLGEVFAAILPPGVFQTLTDRNDLGDLLTSHPGIAHVSFTGSTATGRRVLASAASTLKRFTLELGGNDAALILDDADPQAIAPSLFLGATMNSGQVCLAIKRVYAPRGMMDALCAALVAEAEKVVIGDGMAEGTTMGPVQNAMQRDRLLGLIADSRSHGRIITGGELMEGEGFYIPPTIVRDIPQNSRLVQEEQFGPVLPILPYDDEEVGIALANDTPYGLSASIWSGDVERGFAVASQIESGTVWVNRHLDLPFDVPLGGAKQSGIGRHQGVEGVEEFTQARIVNAALG
ncbi:MAG TPA: aldehyde dehydrogenase family protein [Sphingobium sp.]|uniref:aldehyde dehydrogenase family protein n=1 Tax=Sphingobium sp. TaxID=1912891 RepID=UPI002ED63C80